MLSFKHYRYRISMNVDFSQLSRLYDRIYDDYTRVLIVPVLLVLLALAVLGISYVNTGEAVSKGIDFTGGTAIQVQVAEDVTTADVNAVFPDAAVRTMTGAEQGYQWIIIETQDTFPNTNQGQLVQQIGDDLEQNNIDYRGDISIRTLGAAVGGAFFQQAVIWSGVALLIMSVVIFVAFRTIVPSLAVIFAAVTDIIFALAGMSLFGIDLTLGSLAALLMLLGYSVDTDILLSTRVLKQHKKDLKERIRSSILTGSTMTFAAIAAFTALFTISTSPILDQIAIVIIIGLVADLPVTWLGNAGILKWYVEK